MPDRSVLFRWGSLRGDASGWLVRLAQGWRFNDPFDPLGSSNHSRYAVLLMRPDDEGPPA